MIIHSVINQIPSFIASRDKQVDGLGRILDNLKHRVPQTGTEFIPDLQGIGAVAEGRGGREGRG